MVGSKHPKKANFWRRLSPKKQILLAVSGFILLILGIFSIWLASNLSPLNADNNDEVKIEIESGASAEEVAAILGGRQLIKSNLAYIIYSRITFARVEAGVHYIKASQSIPQIVASLGSAGKTSYALTILPEMTIPEIKELFKKYDFSSVDIEAALNKKYVHPLLADKPDGFDLEGYIFPDTYEMEASDSLESLLERSFDNLYQKLLGDGSLTLMRTKELSIYETLTLASIVGKEAPKLNDQEKIAGVFWNRLDIDMPLGADPTYKYAYQMGYCSSNTPSCESAYNTRIHPGLPPGPIANMKYETIQAVLKPAASDNYYFVAGDDGVVHYAATEDDHLYNIALYCTEQCQ